MVLAGHSAASVSICFTAGFIPNFSRRARTCISSVPWHLPICRSEKPIFFACLTRFSSKLPCFFSCSSMSTMFFIFVRNHGSIADSW